MGNVSVRKDGGSPSGVGVEESRQEMESTNGGSPESMAQSPPHSPREARSPLMFTPQQDTKTQVSFSKIFQVSMIPLQRPDEMQISSHAWIQNTAEYEDLFFEQGIPTIITWSHGGKAVALEGSWDNWKTKKSLQRSGKDFSIMKVLPSGIYQYRFIVDGQWRYVPDMPWAHDDMGNVYNILDLQNYVPEDLESISGFEPPQSPESSYNNLNLGSEDYSKEPPFVPPHLQMTLLNLPSSNMDSPTSLLRPQHVVLNHLYVQKERSGQSVVALGSTYRFLAKYVTVVLYKSLQR
ncbi:hypothetical protein HHK36_005813 [Tetracentron sinense]|uniref:Association with the SNF1 complex (ASC) domain-containing protein n=1 Tax=Tetracentron sinense TaxID=13715 RepID=A0A834ZLP2_TETSI|nr:hypothetical protein HHK36_005813 [Tetracentron sinense]